MTLFYHREGDGANPTLLLLHSGGMTHQEWQPQLAHFASQFDVIAPDLPGHGRSRVQDDEPVSISHYAQKVIELLTQLNVNRVHVVGSSTGAAIALYLAIYHADMLDKLVLYRMGYQKDANAFVETQRIASPEYWQNYGMAKWMSTQHLGQTDDAALAPDAWKAVIARVAALFHPDTTEHTHTLTDLVKIRAKTMLVAGDRDPLVPMRAVLDMAEAIPDSAVWVLPNASHVTATNTWRAKMFAEEVTRFLQSS